jgi:Peptidase inhibitor family I36/Beta/Gamma crystallin
MINRKSIVCVIGLFCLFRAEAASAQPRWGRERLPQAGACFYEDINYGGRYFCVRPGERLGSLPPGMGDKISSLRLVGSAEVTVFRDSNMRGRSARFSSDVRDLRREGWNDQISSIDVGSGDRGFRGGRDDRGRGERLPIWGRTESMPREGACFYEDANFGGQYFCVARGATYTSLPQGFNDRISSVRVFRARVQIFQDRNFGGRSTEFRSDVPNLRGNWRDSVSSIRVF